MGKRRRLPGMGMAAVMIAAGMFGVPFSGAQDTASPTIPNDATEEFLIERIKRYAEVTPADLSFPPDQRVVLHTVAMQQVLEYVDALVARFPESSFKEEAQVIKLHALADLSRLHPTYLERLQAMTDEIAGKQPRGRLASENAFAAIQAFVLGARSEDMPEARRWQGTVERYEAFLEDYPQSERVPFVRASLIRTLVAQNRINQARVEFEKLRQDYPDHRATRRARGELYRATAVGQPFAFTHTTQLTGETICTADYRGKVLIIHFWATWDEGSTAGLPALVDLHRRYGERGLQLIGVNIDEDERLVKAALGKYEMPWPQYFDGKGSENEVLVEMGVYELPTYFVVDRRGIVRAINPSDSLEATLQGLLDESPATAAPPEGPLRDSPP